MLLSSWAAAQRCYQPQELQCFCLHRDTWLRSQQCCAQQTPPGHLQLSYLCFCAAASPCFPVLTAAAYRVFEREGVQVVCDTVSMDFLKGAVIEFEDNLMRSAFQVSSSASTVFVLPLWQHARS
jgi:hypothetical protein